MRLDLKQRVETVAKFNQVTLLRLAALVSRRLRVAHHDWSAGASPHACLSTTALLNIPPIVLQRQSPPSSLIANTHNSYPTASTIVCDPDSQSSPPSIITPLSRAYPTPHPQLEPCRLHSAFYQAIPDHHPKRPLVHHDHNCLPLSRLLLRC